MPVTIPRAERFAIHKLIVSVERQDQAKSSKDTLQAAQLIEILNMRRPLELAESWETALSEGERWREKLEKGRERLPVEARDALADVLDQQEKSRKRWGK